MNLYLDDDSASSLLVRLLRQQGHDVQIPAGAGLGGRDDPMHLIYAIDNGRVCLTGNHDHFFVLHNLVLHSGGHHPGILVVRKENNPRRDLSPRGIVNAIRKLEATGIDMRDTFQVLNQWR